MVYGTLSNYKKYERYLMKKIFFSIALLVANQSFGGYIYELSNNSSRVLNVTIVGQQETNCVLEIGQTVRVEDDAEEVTVLMDGSNLSKTVKHAQMSSLVFTEGEDTQCTDQVG
jgi:hypothetical protein